MRSSLFFFLFSLAILSSCRDDLEDFSVTTESNLPPAITVDAKITGLVLTSVERPVPQGTLVSSPGLGTVTTNEYGRFSFPSGPVNANGQQIFVHTGDDNFELRTVMPNAGATIYEVIQSRQREPVQFFGDQGGELELENGVRLNVPAGSVRSNGSDYAGMVLVSATHMAPENIDDMLNSPGNARGFVDGEFFTLESYGMIDIDFSIPGGGSVTFDPLAPAQLFFPLSPETVETAPDSIDFWQIEEANWLELDNMASRDGLFYSAPITASGIYNCDIPHQSIRTCGRITNAAGAPMPHHIFAQRVEGGQIVNAARTDEQGRFCAWGPRDVNIELLVVDPCNGNLFETFAGNGGGIDLDLGTISVDANTTIIPTGLDNCPGGEAIENEKIGIYVNGYDTHKFYYHVGEDLTSSIALPDCGNGEEFMIQAISLDKSMVSRIIKRSAGDDSPLTPDVCSLLDDDESFELSIDGENATAIGLTTYLKKDQISGETNYEVNVSGSLPGGDEFSMHFRFPEATAGSFTAHPTDVSIRQRSPSGSGPNFNYGLEDDEDLIINLTSVNNQQSTVTGNFDFLSRKFDEDQQLYVASDIPVSVNFQLNL